MEPRTGEACLSGFSIKSVSGLSRGREVSQVVVCEYSETPNVVK